MRPPDWSRLDADVLDWQMGTALNAAFIRSLFELRRMVEPGRPGPGGAWRPGRIVTIERAFADMAAAE